MNGSNLFGGLWRHPNFLKFWFGQTVSLFGTLIGKIALPFVAVLVLDVSAFEMGLLRAAAVAPGLVVGLFAGVWVDRLRRRPIMIVTDLGQALLVGSVPLAYAVGALRIEQLYVVAFATGVLTVFFEIAYRSYLPTLVDRANLLEGNSKLGATGSIAEVAGFGLGGMLVQALTAPITVLVDAISFLISAVSLALIDAKEPEPEPSAEAASFVNEVRTGLSFVARHEHLRTIAAVAATHNIFQEMIGVIYILYVTRDLAIEPGIQGALYAFGGVSSLIGSVFAGRLADRFGIGPTLFWALVLGGLGNLLIPVASAPFLFAIACLIGQQFFGDGALTVYYINQVTLRQGVTPDRLQGRMHATIRFIGWTAMVVGTLAGGVLGELIGLRATLAVAGVGTLLCSLWLLGSPLGRLRTNPTPIE